MKVNVAVTGIYQIEIDDEYQVLDYETRFNPPTLIEYCKLEEDCFQEALEKVAQEIEIKKTIPRDYFVKEVYTKEKTLVYENW